MLKDSPEKIDEFVNSHPCRYHSFDLSECYRELHHWWAQSLEARGRLNEAELYYSRVKDYVSLVRVYCCGGKEEAALELCNETGDAAACYHLARQMEAKGDVDRAIQLFTRARAFSCAVRLAKVSESRYHRIQNWIKVCGRRFIVNIEKNLRLSYRASHYCCYCLATRDRKPITY